MNAKDTPPIGAPLPQAIELVVNSGGDMVDPGDGVLTLREAIADQQQAPGVSARITFATGINAVELTQGELFIGGGPATAAAATLTIDGGTGVTISQSGPATDHNGRLLHIDGTDGAAPQLALADLVFTGGSVQSYDPSRPSQIGYGGGLLAENATVALTDVTVRGNRVDLVYGGKLGGGGVALVGCTTTISGGSIEDNTVAGPSGAVAVPGLGGGILAINGGSLTLSNTSVTGNSCTSIGGAAGGGISLNGTNTTLDHVTVERNTAGSVNNPSGYNNFASEGGGIAALGGADLTVSYSTVGANYVYGPGASGAGISANGRLTVEHSLLTDNHAKSPSLALGGGIYVSGGVLALSDSTVEGNKLYTAGQGVGGGVNVRNSSASIISATIVGNTGSTGTYGTGGVDLSEAAGANLIHNSIIAGNTGDVADVRGYIASDGHNLFSSTKGIIGQQPTDIVTSSPGIAPLADNGGPTQTMALRPGSPALDAGLDGDAVSTTDQRGTGFERISGGSVDIGAFETQQAGGVERLFTPGDDTVDLRGVDLALLPGALGTQALAGDDTIRLSTTQNRGELFLAGRGDDVVTGGSAGDRIAGEVGDDVLIGGGRADVLRGGPGDDVLHGRRGFDELHGGADADRFVYADGSHAPHGTVRFDEILDFSRREGDRIDLRGIDAAPRMADDQRFTFVGRGPLDEVGELRARALGDGDFLVSGQLDRDSVPEFSILVRTEDNLGRLERGDFLL